MKRNKLQIELVVLTLLICVLLAVISIELADVGIISRGLADAIIAEVIGSGVLGFIIAGAFYYLQEASRRDARVEGAKKFLDSQLKQDLLRVFSKDESEWDRKAGREFYFEGSYVNPLNNAYIRNKDQIDEFSPELKQYTIVQRLQAFHIVTERSYRKGERLDHTIAGIVRDIHHDKGVFEQQDAEAIQYVKFRLYAEASIADIENWFDTSYGEDILERCKKDASIRKLSYDLKTEAASLRQLAGDLKHSLGILPTRITEPSKVMSDVRVRASKKL